MEDNLQRGRVRLVIVVDKVNDELRRTVQFLNDCTGPQFQVLCAELRYFAAEHVELLVPTLIGVPTVPPRTSGRYDEASVFEKLVGQCGEDVASIARRVLEWGRTKNLKITWGKGQGPGTFSLGAPSSMVMISATGTITLNFGHGLQRPPFDDHARRLELLRRFNSVPGFAISEDHHNGFPEVPLTALKPLEVLSQFLKILEETASEIRAAAP